MMLYLVKNGNASEITNRKMRKTASTEVQVRAKRVKRPRCLNRNPLISCVYVSSSGWVKPDAATAAWSFLLLLVIVFHAERRILKTLVIGHRHKSLVFHNFLASFGQIKRNKLMSRRAELRIAVCEHEQGPRNGIFAGQDCLF